MKSYTVIITLFAFFLVVCSGCLQQNKEDLIIKKAQPYIKKIVFVDSYLRTFANSIIKNCSSTDKECHINAIYRYMVEHFNYLADPESLEFIQGPNETIQIGGGDCEDLTILLCSLLENIGIKTYILFLEKHMCAMASDINTSKMLKYIKESLINRVKKEWDNSKIEVNKTFILQGYETYYYGGNGTSFQNTEIEYMKITYEIESSKPLTIYIVPSKHDYELYKENKEFNKYQNYTKHNILKDHDTCILHRYGGIILDNLNFESATVHLKLTLEFQPSFEFIFRNKSICTYEIDNKTCIVLDPAAGENGYPGYLGNYTGEKIAVDPLAKKYFYLE